MFGYSSGETVATTARKQGYRILAQAQWPFLTSLDLSMLHNEAQLVSMIKDRSGLPLAVAQHDVAQWMKGKQF